MTTLATTATGKPRLQEWPADDSSRGGADSRFRSTFPRE
jgi:hypothetical protein